MNATSQLAESVRVVLEHPTRGIVGLVDDLFRLCPEQGFELNWSAGQCWIRSFENGCDNVSDTPFRKSVFRAILARIVALCNEQSQDAVSPYGGQAELCIGEDRQASFRVRFVNTSGEQKLSIMPSANCDSLH